MLHRVPDEVGGDPLDPPPVGVDDGTVSRDGHRILPSAGPDHGLDQRGHVHRLEHDALAAGVEPRDLHEVVDQPPETSDVPHDELAEVTGLGRQGVEVLA